MHIQVYEHHTRLIADDMFLKAIKLALEEGCIAEEDFKISSDTNRFINNFLKLDDFSIQHKILQNSEGIAKNLILDIRNRRLLKRALEVPLTKRGVENPIIRKRITEMSRKEIEEAEKKIADKLGINPAHVIVHLQSIKIKLYERFEQTFGAEGKPIYVKRRNKSVFAFDEESPISAALSPIRKLYVFSPKKHVSKTKTIAENLFNVKAKS